MNSSMESHCLSFREIPHTTKLFSTFLEDFPRVASFYAHPPTLAGIDAAAREVRLDSNIRRQVCEILREQNQKFNVGRELDAATNRNLDRLARGAVAIVTGQQTGLFSGPAYTIYKAVSAIRIAEEATSGDTDAVPIFWLATEDHDLAEVHHSDWNTREGLVHYELPARTEDAGRRVGEIPLGDEIEAIVVAATQALEGPFAEEVARALRESYTRGETYGSAFGKLMARLFAGRGIIFIDPLDARLHRLAAPIYLRALDEADSLGDALLARSNELESAGFHAQVKVTRETTLLFYNVDGRREPVRRRNGNFAAGDAEFSRQQLTSAFKDRPDAFTPSALLRPIVQDSLLPTAAYIGGPAEIAYLAQSNLIYKQFIGRMPAILPRASFTVVEPPIARFLEQYGLNFRDILAGPQHLRAKMEQKFMPGDLANRFDAGETALRDLLAQYGEPLKSLDPTLVDALRASEQKMLHQFTQLKAKVARAINFRSGVLDRHQRILVDALHPAGGLQERTLSALPFLAAHSSQLLDDLAALSSTSDPAIASSPNVPVPTHAAPSISMVASISDATSAKAAATTAPSSMPAKTQAPSPGVSIADAFAARQLCAKAHYVIHL
ncbi:MAG TPA: bacillithiol biosynthesis cysteine-adding enzyme BshC [Verrucomicrobiae bacterium]|nr:bacillithiol biosynthesis cysteine-adding enzyme BshC [Verrucomicrobiae bacterium]